MCAYLLSLCETASIVYKKSFSSLIPITRHREVSKSELSITHILFASGIAWKLPPIVIVPPPVV